MSMVEFVAEVSSNHQRDLKRCLEFISTAAEMGSGAVKFQLFKIEELFAPEILKRSPKHRERKQWELPVSFLPEISAFCREKGIRFSCTPFSLDAVEELYPHLDFYKVASYEIMWKELLSACAQTGKPVVLSTGMASLDEVRGAVDVVAEAGCKDLTLLHCVSCYPTPVDGCNVSAIGTLRREFSSSAGIKMQYGWSDHSVDPAVIYRAVHRFGAEMVEFHLDIEGKGEEFGAGHCWLPGKMRPVIETVNKGFAADGSGEKTPHPCELPDRDWRADPSDGLRPLLKVRRQWRQKR